MTSGGVSSSIPRSLGARTNTMDLLGLRKPGADSPPLSGAVYISTLHKYLRANLPRLAPNRPAEASVLAQTYTLFTLGLDPSSAPLSRNLKVPLTLGFGTPSNPKGPPPRPIPLRISPDRLFYLLLRWQSLPQALPHVGRTDVPIQEGLALAARGDVEGNADGETQSIRSWVPSMRSVSLGSADVGGWFRKEEINEDGLLLGLYEIFTVLPALQLHPPKTSEKPIAELIDAGGYTSLGGIDVRVPLDVLRNLSILELDGYDPRGLLIPLSHTLRSLTVRDVGDGDDWIEELLTILPDPPPDDTPAPLDDKPASPEVPLKARFPNLRYLSIRKTNLLSLPSLPLSHLAHLDLSRNLLDSLPSSLSSLSSLVTLNLSHNCITSLRNAPSTLGNISTLNLAYNQIDCLVGLERVLGLQRVDVRNNELSEVSEVGRLGVLPGIKEVWCAGNTFDREGVREEWRVELGMSMTMEGKEVLVDDTPWSWNEKRRIDAGLAAKGHRAGKERHEHTHRHAEEIRKTHTSSTASTSSSPAQSTSKPPNVPAKPISPTTVANAALAQKKRRPRRVIKLDSEQEVSTGSNGGLKPLRLGDRQSPRESSEGSGEDAGVEEIRIRSKGSNRQRSKLSAQTFEPDTNALERQSLDSSSRDGKTT